MKKEAEDTDTIKVGKNSLCTSCSCLHSPHAIITYSSLKLGFQRDPFRGFWVLHYPWFQHISKWFLNLCKVQAYIASLDIFHFWLKTLGHCLAKHKMHMFCSRMVCISKCKIFHTTFDSNFLICIANNWTSFHKENAGTA